MYDDRYYQAWKEEQPHTHTVLTVDVGSDYVKAASTAESDHSVHRETKKVSEFSQET